MFIKLLVVEFGSDTESRFVFFDANTIVMIEEQRFFEEDQRCYFTANGVKYHAQSYTADGLVELIMQARLRPHEMLPSLYVGKRKPADVNENNVAWSAKDNA